MALWRKSTVPSKEKQQRRRTEHEEKIIVRRCSFYHYWEVQGSRPNERYECAGNRRAADVYVQNF